MNLKCESSKNKCFFCMNLGMKSEILEVRRVTKEKTELFIQ
ncbi:MAG: hypothetical protein NT038_03665 [Euryarchaeota archaeon]|nr:hypothetical protein [Euryarchaeota archaeon]